jgi:hypothetical protein
MRTWTITIAATALSTYALDATATAAGLLLVATGLLSGFAPAAVAVVLAASYGLWALGMRANLAANWALLERTATSTNAFSKAAYALTRRRHPRVRRLAASAGYVVTELAKEAGYYIGAFGAVLASDAVSSADAMVFLAGTNAGAAAYEYAVARATRALLRRSAAEPVGAGGRVAASRGVPAAGGDHDARALVNAADRDVGVAHAVRAVANVADEHAVEAHR